MNFLLLIACLFSFNSLRAEGLPDAWKIDEALIDSEKPQPEDMPKVVLLSPLLKNVYEAYSRLLMDQSKNQGWWGNYYDTLSMDKVTFYVVNDEEELNAYCASGDGRVYVLPDGAKIQKVSCSTKSETFLVESLFKKMTLFQQALLLIHERLCNLKDFHGEINYKAIAGLTSGLAKIIEIKFREENGHFQKLTASEKERIRLFYDGNTQISLRNFNLPDNAYDWMVHENGGGLIWKNSDVDPSVFLSIASAVEENAKVGSDTVIIDSYIPRKTQIENNVTIKSLRIGADYGLKSVFIGKNSELSDVTIGTENVDSKAVISIGEDAEIKESKIGTNRFILGEKSRIIKSKVCIDSFMAGKNLSLEGALISRENDNGFFCSVSAPYNLPSWQVDKYKEFQNMVLGENETLIDGKIIFDTIINFAPRGAQIDYIGFAAKKVKTECYHSSLKKIREQNRYTYGCIEETKDRETFDEVNKIPDFSKSPGLQINLVRKLVTGTFLDTDYTGSKRNFYATMLTSFDLEFRTNPLEGDSKGLYMIKNQKIVPAGELIKRSIKTGLHFESIVKMIRENFTKKGAIVEGFSWNLEIYLPYQF